ncbi:Type i restriction-modification system, specificity subunit S [Klebsiella pneumoniae]|uniref:restriction endonuclease subunit S n=1 Tax=Klebsiella pneumoniae TaxID=573 RepID=UPI00102F06DF|nr:restriction endonuclease subunit S [Klebsiella pneumoniae]MCQ8470178.1 restriction endonuclease subunit S [Klebsiella pneumoniae]QBF23607.1 Type i restriction-modification system, specificity subunit S [Klebsiella pneumoniae]HCT2470283.1 restriction endonuclease subunit S [Klebsiella pneumoniae]
MSQYPAYSSYVATDCDWFPKIPEHWILDRAKWAVKSCQNGVWGYEPDGDDDLVCIRVADFDRQSLNITTTNLTMRSIPSKDRNNRLLKSGDLLLEKSGGGDQQLVGAVVEYNQEFPAVSSNFVARMEVNDNTDSRFIVYVHAHLYSGRVNYRAIKQTTGIQNLDSSAYLNEKIAYPPLEEQKVIAKFLDHKTAQIDALIAKKQSLLEKLAEQRGSLISQAVTKGLNDSAPMKESDVTWLGEIPRHWETKRLRFLMTMSGGLTPRTSEPRYWGGDIPWVSPKDMKSERLSSSIDTLTEDALNETTLRLYPPGKVLIVVRGMILAHTVPVAVNEVPVTVNQDMKVLETTMNPEYLAVLLRGIQSLVLSIVEESAHGTKVLRTDLLKNMVLPVPPRVEQDEIVSEVARISSRIDRMVSTVTAAITKLHEYRAALVTNAVTGKIDVRDFCIPTTTEQREVAHG